MSATLFILCLAALCMTALIVSLAIGTLLSGFDWVARWVAPRHRVRLWLFLSAAPIVIGLVAVAAALLPVLGFGHDHCLAHGGHHPHLCPHHVGGAPGIALLLVAGMLVIRGVSAGVELLRGLRLSGATSRALVEASELSDGVFIFPSQQPQAFVLGGLRPRVHVSRGLWALGPEVVEPVLAHERVHAAHRDLLWRALCPMLALGHWPFILSALRKRLSAAQELAADAEAAEGLADGRLRIAEALVVLSRLAPARTPGISFTDGDLKARVHALLEGRHPHPGWRARLLLVSALVVPIALGLGHDLIHHGLETLLGALS